MGLYTYSRMPFGPKNSGTVFARFVESLLSKLRSDQVIAYLDDILVFTADVMSHVDQLEKVLELHRHAGIKLRPKKTHLFQESSDYLGFAMASTTGYKAIEQLVGVCRILSVLHSRICSTNKGNECPKEGEGP